jgi:uncharacterized protein YecT (DUF1311 family)
MRPALFLLFSVVCATAYAQDPKDLEAAQKALSGAYNQALAKLSKPEQKKLIVASQRAWVSHRDSECAFAQSLTGSADGKLELRCRIDMTKDRAEFFERLLKAL